MTTLTLRPPTTTGEIRPPDPMGDGAFGAPRGNRLHAGVDFVALHGEAIVAPCDGIVGRLGVCYSDDPGYKLIEIESGPMFVRVLYIDPCVRPGQAIAAGTPIGLAQNIAARYGGGMRNHVHLDVRLDRNAVVSAGERPLDRVYIDPTFLI